MDMEGMPGGMMDGMDEGAEPEGSSSAKELNSRLNKIISEIKDLERDARESGIYADRASIQALRALGVDAKDIHSRWLEQGGEGSAPKEHQPAKVIEIRRGGMGKEFTGFGSGMMEDFKPNAYGGQTFKK